MSTPASAVPIAGAAASTATAAAAPLPVDDGEERAAKRLKRESAAALAAAAADEEDDEDMDDEDDDGGEAGGKKSGSKGGSSCHQCKSRRNTGALIYCSAHLDKNGKKKCRKKVCGHCLKKFYKESVAAIVDKSTWKCPSCRKICCCAACRRRKTKESGKADADEPMPAASSSTSSSSTKKKKKASDDHPAPVPERSSTRERRTTYSSDHHYGGHGEDEGYPPSANHRRSAYGESPARGRHASNAYDMMDTGGYSSNDQYYSDSDGQGGDGASEMASEDAGEEPVAPVQHEDEAASSLPSSQFTALLSSHIKSLAEESARSPNSPFARLYKQAQATRIKKKIKAILLRPDIRKEKKVELIAALLAPLEDAE